MAIWTTINLDHRRAGFPANRVSGAHLTITDDREYHLHLVSQDGSQNRYNYDQHGNFMYQTGAHADYLYNTFRQAHNDIARTAWDEYSAVARYIA